MGENLTNNQPGDTQLPANKSLAHPLDAEDTSDRTYDRHTEIVYPTRVGNDPLRVDIDLKRVTAYEQNCNVIYFNIHGDKHPYEVLQGFPNNYIGRETYNPALLSARDFIQKHLMVAAAADIEKLGLEDAVSECGSGKIFYEQSSDPLKTFWFYNGSSAQLRFPFKDNRMDWSLYKATAGQVEQIYEGVIQSLEDNRATIQELIDRNRVCQPLLKPEPQDIQEYNNHIRDC